MTELRDGITSLHGIHDLLLGRTCQHGLHSFNHVICILLPMGSFLVYKGTHYGYFNCQNAWPIEEMILAAQILISFSNGRDS